MFTTQAWFPNLKVMSHLVLNNRLRTSWGKLSVNEGNSVLPITDFVAPVSRMPLVPCVEKKTGSGVETWQIDCISTVGLRRLSFLGTWLFGERWLTPQFPFIRRRSRSPIGMVLTTWITCVPGSSSEASWRLGNCMSSIGSASGSVTSRGSSAVEVIAAEVPIDVAVKLALDLSGHSAFQCPGLPQRRHVLSNIRCCNDFLGNFPPDLPRPL